MSQGGGLAEKCSANHICMREHCEHIGWDTHAHTNGHYHDLQCQPFSSLTCPLVLLSFTMFLTSALLSLRLLLFLYRQTLEVDPVLTPSLINTPGKTLPKYSNQNGHAHSLSLCHCHAENVQKHAQKCRPTPVSKRHVCRWIFQTSQWQRASEKF